MCVFLSDHHHRCLPGILEGVGLEALCYVVLLLMPVLGRMSDQQEDVRLMASRCFATLVTLMPLEASAYLPYHNACMRSCWSGESFDQNHGV